jgi:hypothetical protein
VKENQMKIVVNRKWHQQAAISENRCWRGSIITWLRAQSGMCAALRGARRVRAGVCWRRGAARGGMAA